MAFNPAQKSPTEADLRIASDIDEGGSSTYLDSRKTVTGRGFMVGQASDELKAGQQDPEYPLPASPQEVSNFHAEHAARHMGDPNAAQGGWKISDESYVMDVSRRIKDPDEARTAGNEQLQQAAFALPNTAVRLPRGARAGKDGSDVLLSMGAFKTPMELPKEPSESDLQTSAATPVPKVLHQFGVNDSDSRWNPTLSGTRGFTRYEAQNRSWKVVGGTVGGHHADGTPTEEAPQRHTMGELLRGINERRTEKARDFYAYTHRAVVPPSGTLPTP